MGTSAQQRRHPSSAIPPTTAIISPTGQQLGGGGGDGIIRGDNNNSNSMTNFLTDYGGNTNLRMCGRCSPVGGNRKRLDVDTACSSSTCSTSSEAAIDGMMDDDTREDDCDDDRRDLCDTASMATSCCSSSEDDEAFAAAFNHDGAGLNLRHNGTAMQHLPSLSSTAPTIVSPPLPEKPWHRLSSAWNSHAAGFPQEAAAEVTPPRSSHYSPNNTRDAYLRSMRRIILDQNRSAIDRYSGRWNSSEDEEDDCENDRRALDDLRRAERALHRLAAELSSQANDHHPPSYANNDNNASRNDAESNPNGNKRNLSSSWTYGDGCHDNDDDATTTTVAAIVTSDDTNEELTGRPQRMRRVGSLNRDASMHVAAVAVGSEHVVSRARRRPALSPTAASSMYDDIMDCGNGNGDNDNNNSSRGISRTSYIYQRMDFDEGMHSFAELEDIDVASFWEAVAPRLPVAKTRSVVNDDAINDDDVACNSNTMMTIISPAVEATLIFNVGQVRRRTGDLDGASACYDRALGVLTAQHSGQSSEWCRHHHQYHWHRYSPLLIPILHNIGQLQYRRGELHDAMDTYSMALACAEELYGDRHPHVASALNCLGVLHYHHANSSVPSSASLVSSSQRMLSSLSSMCGVSESNDSNNNTEERDYANISCCDMDVDDGGDNCDDDDDEDLPTNPRQPQQNVQRRSTRKAMYLFLRALSIRTSALGPRHVDVATVLNNVGRIHVQLDEFDSALARYEDALDIRREALGPDSLDYAATAFNAGQSYHQKGMIRRAAQLYREFLRVALAKFGHGHRDVAVVLSGIAQIHQEEGEFDRARELYEASLCAGKAALGEDHSEIAMLLNRMGNFHFERERLDDALKCYTRGLRIEQRVLPPDHPNIVVTLSNLGEIHRQRNEWDEAVRMYGDCIDILRRKHVGGDHADLASTLSTIGLIHDQRGDTCLSLRYLQDALLMRRRLLGNDHLDVSATLVYIGTILYRKGVHSVATELFAESLRVRRAKLGNDHRDVAFVLYNIALVHQQRGCYEEAIEAYGETLRIERLVLGDGHRDVGMTLFKMGEVKKAAGDLEGALRCFGESLEVERGIPCVASSAPSSSDNGQGRQQRQQPSATAPDHAAMARALNEIGNIHHARGDAVPMMEALSEASRLYRAAGLSPNNVVVMEGLLYALELSYPEAAPAA
mmetsp:Transcript_5063/g.12687  ORF Transcript_5063/g.12687 Transcript_5063/m.12687 type:complete len:1180 (+) Transcript_5063:50-3589(+)